MAKGLAQVNYVGKEGLVLVDDVPNWSFLYAASTVKDPRYNVGDRVVLPDSRVFRYAKVGEAITTAHVDYALYFAAEHKSDWYVAFTHTAKAGDVAVTLTGAAALVTKDELRGGFIAIYQAGVANQCVRGIIGNTASDATSPYAYTVYLDAPLAYDITTSDHFEVFANPWSDVRSAYLHPSATHTMCGMPTIVAAANAYTWVQTWGICRVSFDPTPAAYERSVYFAPNGSFGHRENAGITITDQRAGVVILPGTAHSAFIILQISP